MIAISKFESGIHSKFNYIFKLEIISKNRDKMLEEIKDMGDRYDKATHVQGQMSEWNLHKIETFSNLTKKVLKAASQFTEFEYNLSSEFEVEKCWANILREKDFIYPHNHFPADLCATYFLSAPEKSSPLHFIEADEYIPPTVDTLVVYYPHMLHGAPTMQAPGERVTINYNLKLKPELSSFIL